MKSAGLSIALLFLAASVFLGGTYFAVSALFWKPNTPAAVLQIAVLFSVGAGLVVAGAKLWGNWAPAFALILILAGLASLQTTPQSNDPIQAALSRRAFSISGGLLATAGVAIYLLNRRRTTGRLLP